MTTATGHALFIFGTWLIGFVALGLVAFGTYSLLEAIYRRVEPDS